MPRAESNLAPMVRLMVVSVLLSVLISSPGALAAGSADDAPVVTVTYLANEGFLISAGDKRVLVDALFPGIRHYQKLIGNDRANLLAARPPYDGVDVVLASHSHDDHFGPSEARAFLGANPGAVLITTPQALARFDASRGLDHGLSRRMHAVYPAEGESDTFELAGVSIEILNLHHGRGRRPQVENLGFVIDIDGFRVLHIGDTEATLGDFAAYDLGSRGIDLALIPAWFLAEPRWAQVTRSIRPRAIAAMHLAEAGAPSSWFGSADSSAGRKRSISRAFPGAWIPESPLETRTYAGAIDRD